MWKIKLLFNISTLRSDIYIEAGYWIFARLQSWIYEIVLFRCGRYLTWVFFFNLTCEIYWSTNIVFTNCLLDTVRWHTVPDRKKQWTHMNELGYALPHSASAKHGWTSKSWTQPLAFWCPWSLDPVERDLAPQLEFSESLRDSQKPQSACPNSPSWQRTKSNGPPWPPPTQATWPPGSCRPRQTQTAPNDHAPQHQPPSYENKTTLPRWYV